jgi:hypothetical protein
MAQNRENSQGRALSLDDQERLAALNRDIPSLERLWSEQFTVNAPNNRVAIGRRAVLDAFVHGGVINFSRFDREIESVLSSEGIVILMGAEMVVPLTDSPSVGLVAGQAINRRFTHVWRDEGDCWRLFARHANVIPPRELKSS